MLMIVCTVHDFKESSNLYGKKIIHLKKFTLFRYTFHLTLAALHYFLSLPNISDNIIKSYTLNYKIMIYSLKRLKKVI